MEQNSSKDCDFKGPHARGLLFEAAPALTQKLECGTAMNDDSEDKEFQTWLQTQLKQSPLRETFLRPSNLVKIEASPSVDETHPALPGGQILGLRMEHAHAIPATCRTTHGQKKDMVSKGGKDRGRFLKTHPMVGSHNGDSHTFRAHMLSSEVLKYVCVVVLAVVDGALLTAVLAESI